MNAIPSIHYPTLTISLQHSIGTITNLQDTIRKERHMRPVSQYLMDKYNWDMATFQTIDWTVHEQALQNTQNQATFNIKLIHYWLPVCTHRAQQSTKSLCIRCNREDKTQDHWYKCHNSNEFCIQQQESTQKFLANSGLHKSLKIMIINAMYGEPLNNDPQMHLPTTIQNWLAPASPRKNHKSLSFNTEHTHK
jgi:hypothetical protein